MPEIRPQDRDAESDGDEPLDGASFPIVRIGASATRHKETANSTRTAVRERLAARFVELDRLFAKQDFVAGPYSVADAYAFSILNWVNFLAIPITTYPRL
jgi:glutathione S-transferase